MDDLQLLLNGCGNVHVVGCGRNGRSGLSRRGRPAPPGMPPTVCVGDLGQADVHESIGR